MQRLVGLLRAVNVGGTGKLPMADLVALCRDAGFAEIRTYIASGNVVFSTSLPIADAKRELEQRLQDHAGKPVPVILRTADQMQRLLDANPFAGRDTKSTVVIFLDDAPPADTIESATGVASEEIALGEREIYVFYAAGQAASKLKIPASRSGTGRNINTVAKLAEMVSKG